MRWHLPKCNGARVGVLLGTVVIGKVPLKLALLFLGVFPCGIPEFTLSLQAWMASSLKWVRPVLGSAAGAVR